MSSKSAARPSFARATAGAIWRAIVSPARRDLPVQALRGFVRLPIVFDLVSLGLQLQDHRRTSRIKQSYAADDEHHRAVQTYNADVTLSKVFTATRRMEICYQLVGFPPRDLRNERLLIVGPRNRHELLAAWVKGFAWSNIQAIDLYSTHPKIVVMNMERMTWPDECFDAVTMANTLSYSDNTSHTVREVGRILKPGGRFGFTATYDPENPVWKGDMVDAATIADILHSSGFEIVIHLASDKTNSHGRHQTSHYFMARKRPAGESRLDPFSL